MEANELRIGNWIGCRSINSQIKSIREKTIVIQSGYGVSIYIDKIFPIPLTEQWLKDFKFKSEFINDRDGNVFKLGNIKVAFKDNIFYFGMWNIPFKKFRIKIEYVHVFQNLYFALKGKELIKQS